MTEQYKPMRRDYAWLASLIITILGMLFGPPIVGDKDDKAEIGRPDSNATEAREVVGHHNKLRESVGLSSLKVDSRLQAAAQASASWQAANQTLTHYPGGKNLRERVTGQLAAIGENVASGPLNRVLTGWVQSPGHYANIVSGASHVGAATSIGADGRAYWCVIFGVLPSTKGNND